MRYTIDNPKLVKNLVNPCEYNFTGVVKDKNGHIAYYENSKFHRTDGPAIISANGDKYWYIHGQKHRTDGPAVIWVSGVKEWFIHGKRHREDGAAVEFSDNDKVYYYNDEFCGVNFTIDSWIKKCKLEIFK